MKKFIVLALFAFLFVAASCMNMSGGSEKGGSIRVALPGSGRYYLYNKENADKFVVRVIGESETIEKDAALGGVIEFTELEAGEYTVEAEARDSANNDELIASGSKDIKVEADKTTECSLTLILLSNIFSIAEDGSIVINKTKLEKTALATVIDVATTITGSGSEGVFIDGRTVTLSPYSIGKYEVTQELFEAVMGENPSKFQGGSYPPEDGETQKLRPVESISWYHAIVFCNRLSILMGLEECYTAYDENGQKVDCENIAYSDIKPNYPSAKNTWQSVSCDLSKNGFRLPTAAEWEFAARGGDQSASTDWNYTYAGTSDINALSDVAWYNNDLDASTKKTHEVGKLKPNRLGLYDMSGNCWEFCSDRSESIPLGVVTDPIAENASGECIRISGSFSDSSTWAHVYSSYTNSVTDTYSNNGIRLARSGFPRAN
ncbi:MULTISPECIES: SUMF1/EgtB/PvdO family nonheme iron enzyme [unclassified Treponema]|uniref:SUMF1/EgtB/PvdO family nonheme iron enzyme n=1 Tax=unclassified Treponema TaxID=2638727 RepID=UPI0025EF513F|nr:MULTISPECIES: SUMF1/EgtB/PvdO family nonheme iron enzyme [unclassified Treponema]